MSGSPTSGAGSPDAEADPQSERIGWLRAWFASARSTFVEATWERRFWVVVSVLGVFVVPLRESLPAVFFMSAWALVKGASNERMQAKREMLEEQAEEAS